MKDNEYWLGFAVCPGIGPKRFLSLMHHFGSAQKSWHASEKDLVPILGPKVTSQFLIFRDGFSFDLYWEKLHKKDIWFVSLEEDDYPELLRTIDNPPFVLFGKGDIHLLNDEHLISVVGTRRITSYGTQVTRMITADLVRSNWVIVSGLALGVDALAHKTTLEQKGKTVAVLGCGVDCCTPRENELLYDQIVTSGGAIISEFPLGMMPSKGSFPSRNRIIAGMAQAVVVTEGAEDSGSLITAGKALEFGRKVFAIPGPITSHLSNGPMRLIKKGAFLVTSGKEILIELGGRISNAAVPIKVDTKEEQEIIHLLQYESLTFDQIIKKSHLPAQSLGQLLSIMELKGYITASSNGMFSIVLSS